MYSSNDPRSTLATAKPAAVAAPTAFAAADYARFYENPPQEQSADAKTWYARGQAFLVSYSEVMSGAELVRTGQADEYMLLLTETDGSVTVTAGGETKEVGGRSLVIVPPGDSRIVVKAACRLVRVFSTRSADLNEKCSNRQAYEVAHPNVAAWQPWPDPVGGYKIRVYPLDVPKQEGRFGCIYRCTTLMVNVFDVQPPRDATKLSPHHHDDFEQGSLALKGAYIHHIRWPWISNKNAWRDDDHAFCGAPSLAVIPPPTIHTSQGIDPAGNHLIDIFAPPRFDFSQKPGWVLNADDYPMPTNS